MAAVRGASPVASREARAAAPQPARAREVDPKKTPLAPKELRGAIASAYRSLHGSPIPERMLDVLTAQACTETAHGASMYNYNFGGIKGASPEGATVRLKTSEVLDGREVKIRDGFRAYASAEAGARDYVMLLERRFPRALDAAKTGDVDGFVGALKTGRYFTADAGQYAASLRGIVSGGFEGGVPSAATSDTRAAPEAASAAAPYPTTLAVVRMLDAVSVASARIAAPDQDEP